MYEHFLNIFVSFLLLEGTIENWLSFLRFSKMPPDVATLKDGNQGTRFKNKASDFFSQFGRSFSISVKPTTNLFFWADCLSWKITLFCWDYIPRKHQLNSSQVFCCQQLVYALQTKTHQAPCGNKFFYFTTPFVGDTLF